MALSNNKNLMQNANFALICKNIPNVEYFSKTVDIPGVAATPVSLSSPFAAVKVHGDEMRFEVLNVTFLVDEDLTNYIEMFNWIERYTHPEQWSQYKKPDDTTIPKWDLHSSMYSDISIQALSNKNNPNVEFIFTNAHPTGMSSLPLSNNNDLSPTTCTVTFEYDVMRISRVNS